MKKNFKYYLLVWFILFCLFNVMAFAIPAWPTLPKFTPSFWIGWGVTIVAFFFQLICAAVASSAKTADKTFYNISLFKVSFAGLITMMVVALICIVITPLPYWVAAIACPLVVIANLIAVIKARVATNIVKNIDKKVETATAFIYEMRAESETILARAKTDEDKALCKKVRDALKYSDPMSKPELNAVEDEIKAHAVLLRKAVTEGNTAAAVAESDELLALITERNNKCKILK